MLFWCALISQGNIGRTRQLRVPLLDTDRCRIDAISVSSMLQEMDIQKPAYSEQERARYSQRLKDPDMVKLAQLFQLMSGSADAMDCRCAVDRCRHIGRFYGQGREYDTFKGVGCLRGVFRAPSLIRPDTACRIISASSELITLSLPTSAAEVGRWIK